MKMNFKSIEYWEKNKWNKLKIKADTMRIETKNYVIVIVDDLDVKKVEISTKELKDKRGRNKRTFVSFID